MLVCREQRVASLPQPSRQPSCTGRKSSVRARGDWPQATWPWLKWDLEDSGSRQFSRGMHLMKRTYLLRPPQQIPYFLFSLQVSFIYSCSLSRVGFLTSDICFSTSFHFSLFSIVFSSPCFLSLLTFSLLSSSSPSIISPSLFTCAFLPFNFVLLPLPSCFEMYLVQLKGWGGHFHMPQPLLYCERAFPLCLVWVSRETELWILTWEESTHIL